MSQDIKFRKLLNNLNEMYRVVIAFSGGVDSTFLLKAACMSGIKRTLAVTGFSESMPEEELAFCRDFTAGLGAEHRVIRTHELRDSNYSANPPDRCYYCKKELFTQLGAICSQEGFAYVLDGTNADDSSDWRPGTRAAAEHGVRSPLLEAGLGKDEIRKLSRSLNLPTWDKPSSPCLSSRFPYGQEITAPLLERVKKAEQFIRKMGIRELRVRNHGDTARIEIPEASFSLALQPGTRQEIITYLKSLGYRYVTLDLQGFRSGSGNPHA